MREAILCSAFTPCATVRRGARRVAIAPMAMVALAITGACVLMRREVFQQIGGFDETLSNEFAQIDLCLKIRRSGYLIVYTPLAKLYWDTSSVDDIDNSSEAVMRQRWSDVLERDPYYNPNLSRKRADFSLGD